MEVTKQKMNQALQNVTINALELKPIKVTVKPTQVLSKVYDLMVSNRVTSIPVVDKEVLGFVLLLDVICSTKSEVASTIMKQTTSISPLDPIQLLFPIFTFDPFQMTIVGDGYVTSMDLLRYITQLEVYNDFAKFKLRDCARFNLKLPLHEPKELVTCDSSKTVRQVIELLKKASSVCVMNGKERNVVSVTDLLSIPMNQFDQPIQAYLATKKPVDGFANDEATIGEGIDKMLRQNIHRIWFQDDVVSVSDILSLFVE